MLLKGCSDYDLDDHSVMTASTATKDHFRYIDGTAIAEALYGSSEGTLEKESPPTNPTHVFVAYLRDHLNFRKPICPVWSALGFDSMIVASRRPAGGGGNFIEISILFGPCCKNKLRLEDFEKSVAGNDENLSRTSDMKFIHV